MRDSCGMFYFKAGIIKLMGRRCSSVIHAVHNVPLSTCRGGPDGDDQA